jgi:uncharacterized protein YuzE
MALGTGYFASRPSGMTIAQEETMRVRVDRGADAVYVNLTDRPIKESEEVADGIVVDYDDQGRIVGVEILDASKRTDDPEVLKTYSFDVPAAG